jgi:ubiquinone/menaquinone biosynthesis C-methylase UbiE
MQSIKKQTQAQSDLQRLRPYLQRPLITLPNDILAAPIDQWTPGMIANRDFFNHTPWSRHYLRNENTSQRFRDRLQAAIATTYKDGWQNKTVVDIGCGPGNVLHTLSQPPKQIIGIDIADQALQLARQTGYIPLRADAHHLPLIDQFADLVILNATLHHCDNMAQVLREAARLVRPGGLLITDQDPQRSAWELSGLGQWLHQAKYSPLFPLFRYLTGKPLATWNQQMARFPTEIHNQQPGHGLTATLYHQILEPDFQIQLFPHNHTLGKEVLQGQWGKAPRLIRTAQILSGKNPNAIESAQSILCIAQRNP